MTAMRSFALVAAALLAFGGLAGCFGKDEPVDANSVDPKDPTGSANGGTAPVVKVLAPLALTASTTSASWVAPGSMVAVEATTPAKGNVTYTWAIGALPDTVAGPTVTLDTKDIAPNGASKPLRFTDAGVYALHCHPHPYMKHNVTVVEGYKGPSAVEVLIVDGAKQNEYRFVPENIVVAPGTTVTYKNIGAQMHTATLEGAQPALKALDLTTASGEVKVEGNGWMRIVSIAKDADGRVGLAEIPIYVKDIPADFSKQLTGSFSAGGLPAQVQGQVAPAQSHAVNFELGGTATLTITVSDAGAELNQVKVHLAKQGEAQDTATSEPTGSSTLEGVVNAGNYVILVEAAQGSQIDYTIDVAVAYDLVPPAPTKAAAEGDSHGGHAH